MGSRRGRTSQRPFRLSVSSPRSATRLKPNGGDQVDLADLVAALTFLPPSRPAYFFRADSIRIILYSLPVLGSAANSSTVFVSAPVTVSTCRITTGFFWIGQL